MSELVSELVSDNNKTKFYNLRKFLYCSVKATLTLELPLFLAEVVDPLESMFPPELSILRNTDPREHTRPDLPFLFTPDQKPSFPFPPTLEDQAWSRRGPEEQRGALSGILNVQCEESRMVVSIDKESLQVTTYRKHS